MATLRKIAWLGAAISGVVLVLSASEMARRVAAFHKENRREVYAFKAVNTRSFEYSGRPVTLRDLGDGSGNTFVVTRYGDDEIKLRATIPGDLRLPDLLPHQDWLRVLRFAAATGYTLDQLRARMDSGEVRDRLVIVTRTPEAGSDPSSWGETNRRAWKFDFYEFKPEGGFAHERKSFPNPSRPRVKTNWANLFSSDEPVFTVLKPPRAADELEENTWQFQAALQVMPPARAPNPRFTNDGLHAMGWTLPATSLSILALVGSLMVAGAPRGRSDRVAKK